MCRLLILSVLLLAVQTSIFCQEVLRDTLKLDIYQAEEIFLKQNLSVLAQKYNVDAAGALIVQARLYPNPNFNLEQGAYNPQTKQWFSQNYTNGEQAMQISQLIILAGKIKKQTRMAETNYKLALDNLANMMGTLKLGLRSNFFGIYYLQQSAGVYQEEINSLKKIADAYNSIVDKGYISRADLVLIQSRLFSLQAEFQALKDNLNDQQSQLRQLLQLPAKTYIVPVPDSTVIQTNPLQFSVKTLLDSAYVHRPDYITAQDNLTLGQQNYSYQKALAIPDITLSAGYDRHGSYVDNFNALSIGFDIPIFNRNQGNIRNAQIMVDAYNTQILQCQKKLEEDIFRGLERAVDADKLYNQTDKSFAENFNTLASEMLKNYMKKNINLLNFLTFYDAYKQNILQLNTIALNKIVSLEMLNYLTGTIFYNK